MTHRHHDPVRVTRRKLPVVDRLDPHETNGPILLKMTQWIADGGGVTALKEWLIAQGVQTRRGGLNWTESTIRDILHNHINHGGRRSHGVHAVPHPAGVRRGLDKKLSTKRVRIPYEQQKPVADGRVVPIPGLTYDLWRRAIDRLEENKAFSARHAELPEDQRVERALLFGGPVRCAVCGHALRVKPASTYERTTEGYEYRCAHSGTPHEGEPGVCMAAWKLDGTVWSLAVAAMRDLAFLAQLIADTDTSSAAPATRAASLRAQLAQAERDRTRYTEHLLSYDPHNPDHDGIRADIEAVLERNRALRTELGASLEAAEAQVQAEEERKATLAAFHDYATQEAPTLVQKTPLELRKILRMLRTRVRVNRDNGDPWDRLRIVFDITGLPGASTALRWTRALYRGEVDVFAGDHRPDDPTMYESPGFGTRAAVEWLTSEGNEGFKPLPRTRVQIRDKVVHVELPDGVRLGEVVEVQLPDGDLDAGTY